MNDDRRLDETISLDNRLATVLAEYLAAADEQSPPDRETWIDRHPDLAAELTEFFAAHDAVERLASPLRQAVTTVQLAAGESVTTLGYAPAVGKAVEPTTMFGDYEIIEEIARGGMGVVYKARQVSLNRLVAVKMILSGQLASADDVRRFRAEAEAAANLRHPNIVAIHDVGERGGQHFFSMEYVAGKSLSQMVREHPLSPEQAARYVKIVAEAIEYAHRQGILHRDLKPSNVLIDEADQPRITDFGLAKRLGSDSAATMSGMVVGTPSYMSPEQALGSPSIGPAADVYSLGATLYDLVSARPPFRADSPLETLRQVRDCEPASPRVLNPKVPRDLETICLKCLAKDAQQRYAGAADVAEELGRFLEGEPIRARPIGSFTRAARWARRHPLPAGVMATAAVLLLVVTAATLSVARQLERQLRREVLESNKYAARNVANTLRGQLSHWGDAVAEVAGDEDLISALESGAGVEELQQFITGRHAYYASPEGGLVKPGEPSLFTNWFILDRRGIARARSPELAGFLDKDYGFRDYFQGALRSAAGEVHVSHVYLSENDKLYKFALSSPIRRSNTDEPPLGVLVATVATDSSFGLPYLHDEHRKAALVGPLDPPRRPSAGDSPARREVILVHPAYTEPGKRAVTVDSILLRSVQAERRDARLYYPSGDEAVAADDTFFDPIYGGRWLAAFAPVPDSEFVVIVEQRYDDAIQLPGGLARQLVVWGGVAVTLGVVLLGASIGYAVRGTVRRRE
ncbi:MAG TPA: serine/threonine protein kinase [Pirellulales bacterium]|nr:serine/threonine protein kinase [Pirellulales bacterium]